MRKKNGYSKREARKLSYTKVNGYDTEMTDK